jgi:hypothetical protein
MRDVHAQAGGVGAAAEGELQVRQIRSTKLEIRKGLGMSEGNGQEPGQEAEQKVDQPQAEGPAGAPTGLLPYGPEDVLALAQRVQKGLAERQAAEAKAAARGEPGLPELTPEERVALAQAPLTWEEAQRLLVTINFLAERAGAMKAELDEVVPFKNNAVNVLAALALKCGGWFDLTEAQMARVPQGASVQIGLLKDEWTGKEKLRVSVPSPPLDPNAGRGLVLPGNFQR